MLINIVGFRAADNEIKMLCRWQFHVYSAFEMEYLTSNGQIGIKAYEFICEFSTYTNLEIRIHSSHNDIFFSYPEDGITFLKFSHPHIQYPNQAMPET